MVNDLRVLGDEGVLEYPIRLYAIWHTASLAILCGVMPSFTCKVLGTKVQPIQFPLGALCDHIASTTHMLDFQKEAACFKAFERRGQLGGAHFNDLKCCQEWMGSVVRNS
jgi:hypothetical protein